MSRDIVKALRVGGSMKANTRSKMVAGAADLIRRRGVNATSVREVVRHTDTPRGSIGHHFPQGKLQLVEEALAYAGQEVSVPLRKLINDKGVIGGLQAFIGLWRTVLLETRCAAGCSVLAVAVEEYIGEDGNSDPDAQKRLMELANDIFHDWQFSIFASLVHEGVAEARARSLSLLVVSAVEGSVALCRAACSVEPLDEVSAELNLVLSAAIVSREKSASVVTRESEVHGVARGG